MAAPATRFRSLRLLSSTLRQQHWRKLFWWASATYLLLAFLLSFASSVLNRDARSLFQMLQVVHVGLACSLPAALAGRLVDDASSGTLQFAQLAGFTAGAWIRFRLLVIATGYSSVWVLRVPLYMFLANGGGATWEDLFWAEVLHTALAFAVAQVGLLVASRVVLASQTMLGPMVLVGLAFALMLPAGVVMFVTRAWSLRVPTLVDVISEALRSLSIFKYVMNPPVTHDGRVSALGAAGLHALIGLHATRWLTRRLYVESELAAPPSNARKRPSREVCGNPFAWQASEHHLAKSAQVRTTVGVFTAALALALLLALQADVALFLLGMWMVFACVTAEISPAVCAGFELKAKTLDSLAILPCGGTAIYQGWKRAGDRYRLAAWLTCCGCAAVLAWRQPLPAMAWIAVTIAAAWSLPPIAFIEVLRGQNKTKLGAASRMIAIAGSPLLSLAAVQLPNGLLILTGAVAAFACLYRPRAMRQMDELFVRASSV